MCWGREHERTLSFDQADVAGARPLRRFLGLKFHTLTLSEQLEHSTPDGAAMEEVLDTALIPDKPESLVDEEACDCPGGHDPVLRCASIVRFRPSFGRHAERPIPIRKDVCAHRPKSWASVGSTCCEVKHARSPYGAVT